MRDPRLAFVALMFPIILGFACWGCSSTEVDTDQDGIAEITDNCPGVSNPNQIDGDGDGIGDLCEAVACGDGVCDPEAGECNFDKYCLADCDREKCLGEAGVGLCGDGICDPLDGECSNFNPCLEDCIDPDFCFSPTCFIVPTCEPWESDPSDLNSFCFTDCACSIEKDVQDACKSNLDCPPGTVCGPERFPENHENFEEEVRSIPCQCTTCGNGRYEQEKGEGCDPSAGQAGLQDCFAKNGACDGTTCACTVNPCGNSVLEPELGEECDTGPTPILKQGDCDPTFVCLPDQCVCTQCGNNALDPGEECDTGGFIESTPECNAFGTDFICRNDCSCSTCGNGQVDEGEGCDVNSLPSTWPDPACRELFFCPDTCTCGFSEGGGGDGTGGGPGDGSGGGGGKG